MLNQGESGTWRSACGTMGRGKLCDLDFRNELSVKVPMAGGVAAMPRHADSDGRRTARILKALKIVAVAVQRIWTYLEEMILQAELRETSKRSSRGNGGRSDATCGAQVCLIVRTCDAPGADNSPL
jgi:hypothetical protein